MDTKRPTRRIIGWLLAVVAAVALIAVAMEVAEQDASQDAAAETTEGGPATIEHVEGSDLARVTLTEAAVERIELETAPVTTRGGGARSRTVVPYSAVLYDERGRTWVYTRAEELTFVRAPITVEVIRGDRATLTDGPAVGTEVVAVGAAELFGSEFEVDH
jgi:hypothetical protein